MTGTLKVTAGPIECLQCDFKADDWKTFKKHLEAHRIPMFSVADLEIIPSRPTQA